MSDVFGSEEVGQEAILDFTSKRVHRAENENLQQSVEELASQSTMSQTDKAERINSAKFYGNKEIKKYREIIEHACSEIDKLCLFSDVSTTLRFFTITSVLERVIEPIFKGNKPFFIPEEDFKKMRLDMFNSLLREYMSNKPQE